ncbi:hypothetical protein BH23BAC1_BH23BAC1_51060 [soil metagenome]
MLFFASAAIEQALLLITSNLLGSPGNEAATIEVIVNILMSLFIYRWFAFLYKVLPFVKIKWEPTLVGAAVTAFLFFIGTWLLWEFVVVEDSLEDLYHYTAPIVLIAFWIFNNSLAFLYGASFTKVYAELKDKEIEPKFYAYQFKVVHEDK